MALHRLIRPQLVRRVAALRAVLSCLVIVLLVAGPVALCNGHEHVAGVSDPRPYAAAQRQPETAISGEQENPLGRSNSSNSVTPVGAQSASDVPRGVPHSGCEESGATWAASSQSRFVAATDAAQPRPGTLIPDSAGPPAQPPTSYFTDRLPAPGSRQALTLAQLSISRT